jgi:hypothetical protein
MNSYTLEAFHEVLKLLEEYNLRGLFFITGNVVEKICTDFTILKLLEKHEIGFHSSSHSVKPRIFEYTDVPDYEQAVKISMIRETSKINPFSGKVMGNGGILSLRKLFPKKRIESFRAPFDYFSPPHIEALKKLGFRFIFSGDFSRNPVSYKNLTFFPKAVFIDDLVSKLLQVNYQRRLSINLTFLRVFNTKSLVFALHPCQMVYDVAKSLDVYLKNPMHPLRLKRKNSLKFTLNLHIFRLFLSELCKLQKRGLIKVTPKLKESKTPLQPKRADIERNFNFCLSVTRLFGYKPKFLLSHFNHFFKRTRSCKSTALKNSNILTDV